MSIFSCSSFYHVSCFLYTFSIFQCFSIRSFFHVFSSGHQRSTTGATERSSSRRRNLNTPQHERKLHAHSFARTTWTRTRFPDCASGFLHPPTFMSNSPLVINRHQQSQAFDRGSCEKQCLQTSWRTEPVSHPRILCSQSNTLEWDCRQMRGLLVPPDTGLTSPSTNIIGASSGSLHRAQAVCRWSKAMSELLVWCS